MWQKRGNKYNAKRVEFGGYIYDSQLEMKIAVILYGWLDEGKIKEIKRQHTVRLYANGHHVTTARVDFLITLPDDRQKLVEVKGFETPEWRIKAKLIEATIELPYIIVRSAKDCSLDEVLA